MDHDLVDPALLPDESAIAAVTLAEVAAGPHATSGEQERARRQDRLQWAAVTWDPLPPLDRGGQRPAAPRNPADFAGLEQLVTVVAV